MSRFSKIILVANMFISGFGFAQFGQIQVRFIGNCGLYMTDGNSTIYVDFPYKSGAFNYMKYDASELDSIKPNAMFLFTHRHPDHYSKKRLKGHSGKVYGPWKVSKKRRLDLKELNNSSKGIFIQAFRNKHRFSFKHCSYLITWHGKKIFISGDTENAETIAKQTALDWAFVPYWILTDAREKNIKIDAKMRVLYHLYPNQKIDGDPPGDMLILKKQNEVISIPY